MATTTTRTLATSLATADAGDTVALRTSSRRGSRTCAYELVEITRATPKTVLVGGMRFRRADGDEMTRRDKYTSTFRMITVVQPEEVARIEMAEAEAKRLEQKAQAEAQAQAAAKRERRAARFEGTLQNAAEKLEAMSKTTKGDDLLSGRSEADGERLRSLASRFSYTLQKAVWDLESNEREIKAEAARATSNIADLVQRLENDHHLSTWRDDLEKLVEARKALIENAKETLSIASMLLNDVPVE